MADLTSNTFLEIFPGSFRVAFLKTRENNSLCKDFKQERKIKKDIILLSVWYMTFCNLLYVSSSRV